MAAEKLLPPVEDILHWIEDEGLTHQQCADRVYALTGNRVSRSTISTYLHRTGHAKPKHRHSDTLPWKLKVRKHGQEYHAVMLRMLGRRRKGDDIGKDNDKRLDSWLADLDRMNLVVGYDPDTEVGFYYIPKDSKIDGKDGIPIRRKRIVAEEIEGKI